ncbi:hypothetical protein [Pseudomonas sp. RGM2987]|nr:hypothetical protein [Pseudomonas sp. RGM2987]MCJ8204363.1 hypothetical protein [Pseudomonas sp. RGM2987]
MPELQAIKLDFGSSAEGSASIPPFALRFASFEFSALVRIFHGGQSS